MLRVLMLTLFQCAKAAARTGRFLAVRDFCGVGRIAAGFRFADTFLPQAGLLTNPSEVFGKVVAELGGNRCAGITDFLDDGGLLPGVGQIINVVPASLG